MLLAVPDVLWTLAVSQELNKPKQQLLSLVTPDPSKCLLSLNGEQSDSRLTVRGRISQLGGFLTIITTIKTKELQALFSFPLFDEILLIKESSHHREQQIWVWKLGFIWQIPLISHTSCCFYTVNANTYYARHCLIWSSVVLHHHEEGLKALWLELVLQCTLTELICLCLLGFYLCMLKDIKVKLQELSLCFLESECSWLLVGCW